MTTADLGRDSLSVWLLALGQLILYAGSYYSFPAVLPFLEAETGWSKASLAAGPSVGFLLMAGLTMLSGRLVDRGFGGELLVGAPVLAALGLCFLALARSPAEWIAAWALIGVAQAGCLYETCFSFLTRRLGTGARSAITQVTLIAGFSGTVTFPLGHILGQAMGGQAALWVFAGLVLATAVPLNLVAVIRLRRRARAAGLSAAPDQPGALAAALKRPEFWAIAGIMGLIWLNHGILLTYVLELFADRGASAVLAAGAAAFIGPAQVVGRLGLMLAGARISTMRATLASLVSAVLAVALLWSAGLSVYLILGFALLHGAAMGLLSILRPLLTVEVLGRTGFGAISGAVSVPALLGSAAAPAAGALLLQLGGTSFVYGSCLAMTGLALLAGVWLARRGI
ncbi:MFS transporter [Xinfangfangia sp. CPCC 101601]|uniref:MFS transporter n=1 Tax=Pseudogemmobacter lacusdianii TaxID=3069608 RepID=A0ABU0W2C4_9RHOB|nr:MFS transporter [Xinfangfangia sp. CPCC 101601]MDQ2068171.1 MFS transporter [Xinfangfangia sp. CPCC 101601]